MAFAAAGEMQSLITHSCLSKEGDRNLGLIQCQIISRAVWKAIGLFRLRNYSSASTITIDVRQSFVYETYEYALRKIGRLCQGLPFCGILLLRVFYSRLHLRAVWRLTSSEMEGGE